MRLLKRKDHGFGPEQDDIITALNSQPPPLGQQEWHVLKLERPELHLTTPQPRLTLPPRPPLGRALRTWKATLPVFRKAVRERGHRAFLPVPALRSDEGKPMMGFEQAIYSIGMWTDRTNAHTCSLYQSMRAELAERAREYDAREREIQSRRPIFK